MITTDITKEKFDEISKTGYQVVILRDIGKCKCSEEREKSDDVLVNDIDILGIADEIEIADPKCPICLGTGRELFPILTNKIRVTNLGSSLAKGSYFEIQALELMKDDALNFYFPYNYEFLTLKDYIAIVDLDDTNNVVFPVRYTSIFKITNIEVFVRNEFKFYKVFASKKKVI